MTEKADNPSTNKPKRPFLLSILCVLGFTYTSLFSIFFLIGMLYSTGFSRILNKYLQLYDLSRLNFFLFSISGFLIFFAIFIGVLLMWRLQKLGFYIFAFASLAFLGMETIIAGPFVPDILLHILLIILFLIVFPFGKKRRARLITKNLLNKTKA